MDYVEHSIYCRLSTDNVSYTQDIGAVMIDRDENNEIVGVEVMNVIALTVDGERILPLKLSSLSGRTRHV